MYLNDNYRLVFDEDNCILQFHEMKMRKDKTDGVCKPKEVVKNYYYPSMETALNGFATKAVWGKENVAEVIAGLNEIKLLISKIKKNE